MNDFYSLTFRNARKDHVCGCFLAPGSKDPHHYRKHTIRKGQKYAVIAQVWEGSFSTTKLCLTHHALISAIFDVSDDSDDEGVDYARAREHYEQMDPEDQKEILAKMREIHRELKPKKPAKPSEVIDLSARIKDRDTKAETELEKRVIERWTGGEK